MNSEHLEEQVIKLNKAAVEDIKIGKFNKTLSYLGQALEVIQKIYKESIRARLLSQTFNTLGSFFKKSQNISESIKFFSKSIELEKILSEEDKGYVALSNLNLCTIYSQESDHNKALKHGLQALSIIKRIINQRPKLANSLVIANYNIGNEYKILGDTHKAEMFYKNGLSTSKNLLGQFHPLTVTLSNALNNIISNPNNENLQKTQQYSFRADISPVSFLPRVNNKRSSSDSRNYIKSTQRPHENLLKNKLTTSFDADFTFLTKKDQKNVNLYKNSYQNYSNGGSDDEQSWTSEKNRTLNGWKKKIDLEKHKETEKAAAIMIQSWWRGILGRERFRRIKINDELKKAEQKAKRAVEKYENIKKKAAQFNRKKNGKKSSMS
ncbi:hypothetical protein SteCoe_21599 [Stentor coeruleus]|uniref:MalT-like TPR region domain-containing protein n=1 Tax=Stentor coeruleus TaxID=5963 RepID=A0A1R2BPB5_9CILI|nr:hypothetical protein SteCoe_21599 [Stentor coeruleus]